MAQQLDSKTITALTIGTATLNAGNINGLRINGGYIGGTVIEAGKYLQFNYTNSNSTTGRVTVGSGTVSTRLTANAQTTYTGQMFQSSNPGSSTTFTGGTRDSVIIDANAFAVVSKGFAIAANQGNRWAGITVENINNNGAVLILQNRDWADEDNHYSRITLKYGLIEMIFQGGGGASHRVDCDCSALVEGTDGHVYRVPAEY